MATEMQHQLILNANANKESVKLQRVDVVAHTHALQRHKLCIFYAPPPPPPFLFRLGFFLAKLTLWRETDAFECPKNTRLHHTASVSITCYMLIHSQQDGEGASG